MIDEDRGQRANPTEDFFSASRPKMGTMKNKIDPRKSALDFRMFSSSVSRISEMAKTVYCTSKINTPVEELVP